MAKRKPKKRPRKRVETETYTDADGNELELRKALSPATIAKINTERGSAAASIDDDLQRREELIFERLVVRWEIAGLPITKQKELLGRLRLAGTEERRWVMETIRTHADQWIPGL